MNMEYYVQICLSPIFLAPECENKTSSASTNKDLLLNAAYKTMGEAGLGSRENALGQSCDFRGIPTFLDLAGNLGTKWQLHLFCLELGNWTLFPCFACVSFW